MKPVKVNVPPDPDCRRLIHQMLPITAARNHQFRIVIPGANSGQSVNQDLTAFFADAAPDEHHDFLFGGGELRPERFAASAAGKSNSNLSASTPL